MKTNQKNQFVFLGVFLQLAALVLTGCGSNGSSNNTTATTAAAYYASNGQCYTSGTNTVVPYTYCSNTGTNGYTMINGICYQGSTPVSTTLCTSSGVGTGYQLLNGQCYTTTGQVVAINYCQGTTGIGTTGVVGTTGVGTVSAAQVCYGVYYSPQFGQGMCYGNPDNCAGYTMVSEQTGQTVYCQ